MQTWRDIFVTPRLTTVYRPNIFHYDVQHMYVELLIVGLHVKVGGYNKVMSVLNIITEML